MKLSKKLISTQRSKTLRQFLFLMPSLTGVCCFVIIPFGDVILRSFQTMTTDTFCGLANYKIVFMNEAFRMALKNTLRFVLICIPLLIGLSLPVAAVLSKNAYMNQLKSAYLFPLAVPTATVVLIWKMMFDKEGIMNQWLYQFLDIKFDWMGSDKAVMMLVISFLWKNFGYTVLLWLSGILGVPKNITEAAQVDGAGEIKIFIYVILPNLKPVFYTITILSLLNSFKVFREAYLVAGAYPQENIYLLQHLFNNWFTNLEITKMAAAAVIIAILFVGIILLFQKFLDVTPEDERRF